MRLSVVSTLYKSKPFLSKFLEEIIKAIQELNIVEYELVFVNDGSPDNSFKFLLDQKKNIPQIKLIDLSRNFGHHYAIQAGLCHAEGEYIFLIDNDLEVSPLVLIDFFNTMQLNSECDVVYGYQDKRKGKFIESYIGSLFYKVFNFFSETKISENILTERLMTRQYVADILKLHDKNLFLAGLMNWIGYNQIGLAVTKTTREGNSTYTVWKRINLMIEAITSFSAYPLKMLFYFGLIITFFSFLFGAYFLSVKLFYPELVLSGFTSVITVLTFSTGLIILSIGTIGIYLEKVFNQVKNRPTFIVKRIIK